MSTTNTRVTKQHDRQKRQRSAVTRRAFLRAASLSPAFFALASRRASAVNTETPKPTDIRIDEVAIDYQDFPYRTPYKFGGREIDRVTVLNVWCSVHTLSGREARGFGSMPLVSAWAFPSKKMSSDSTLGAMKVLAESIRGITEDFDDLAHPIDINVALEPEYVRAAQEVSEDLHLAEPIPKLCTLVTASAFDAALHDAFGKANGVSSYHAYGRDFMTYDLGHYLGPDFNGEYPDQYLLRDPTPRLAIYHSVGESDPIAESDVKERIHDGMPMSLHGWIDYNGLTHIKIKLAGNNLEWDFSGC